MTLSCSSTDFERGTADRNRSHWSTSKTPSYTKSVSWQHHPYNVEVVFDPPLVNAEHREKSEIPFSKVSVLKNGQSLTSNLCKYEQIKDQIYNINISWASKPKSNDRETNEYVYDMATFEGISYLGARSPLTQIAEQIKGIREDWKPIAQGAKKVKADVYTSSDRNEERTYLQEQHDLAIKRRDEKREKRLESGE